MMIKFRKVSSLPYKTRSIVDLNKKIDYWNMGNWFSLGFGNEFSTPLVKDDERGSLKKG